MVYDSRSEIAYLREKIQFHTHNISGILKQSQHSNHSEDGARQCDRLSRWWWPRGNPHPSTTLLVPQCYCHTQKTQKHNSWVSESQRIMLVVNITSNQLSKWSRIMQFYDRCQTPGSQIRLPQSEQWAIQIWCEVCKGLYQALNKHGTPRVVHSVYNLD